MSSSPSDRNNQDDVQAVDFSGFPLSLAAPPQMVHCANPGARFAPLVPFVSALADQASMGAPAPQRATGAPAAAVASSAGAPLTVSIVDVIPASDSAETNQNSETSIAVNPGNPNQIVLGAFTGNFVRSGVTTDFFDTTNGGATWADYGNLVTDDKTMAWLADGSKFLTSILTPTGDIQTYSGTTTSAFQLTNNFAPANPDNLDQPWIRTGPSNHIYVAYNNLNLYGVGNGGTASVNVSTNGGSTFTPVVIDKVGAGAGQDAPSVRTAVNGNVVYAAFTRWNSVLDTNNTGETRYSAQIVVVRSDNGGADSFGALGASGHGTVVAATISAFASDENGSLTLGQERTGGGLAIAVDPNNSNHVVVAYENAPGAINSGQLQLVVAESTDGGASWTTKFTTSTSVRSDLPAVSILSNGTIGFLYDSYNPSTNQLSQHLLTTSNDFASTTDTLLGTESNATPIATFDPYVGDFNDLTSIGNTFYGTFAASNQDNGSTATILNATFLRDHSGTPGTSSFQLTDGGGGTVGASIDPYFFTATACYCAGTRIATADGEVAVEHLKIGDRVLTMFGALRPLKWIGTRSYSARFAGNNPDLLPIRFKAGSLATSVPARDLLVSPKHAMFLDGVLIPAENLVNGASIVQEPPGEDIHYFHLELETHDVLIAEGAFSESFVDDDSRGIFQNAHEFGKLYPEEPAKQAVYCAPRVEDGFVLDRARRRLAGRAGLAYPTATDFGALLGEIEHCDRERVSGWALNTALRKAPVCLDVIVDGAFVAYACAETVREKKGGWRFDLRYPAVLDPSRPHEIDLRRSADGVRLDKILVPNDRTNAIPAA
ncbi:Hint domain-containing protein [Rhodoblastus sp.]|uniref:Hint domain-containing protein n=1 Tax=Rhodoblastus sp. TaxID=1962975 RepID=UPI0026217CDD|nr:Hint domain-containing protein [Rhodoblastus sp.]